MEPASALEARVAALLKAGDLAAAEAAVRADASASAAALNAVARALLAAGRAQDAVALLEIALARDEAFGPAHFNMAKAMKALGDSARALAHARRAAECQPAHVASWNNYANLLSAAGRAEEADAAWAHALSVEPRNASVWLNRLRAAAGDPERAAQIAHAAMPHIADAPDAVAECLREIARTGGSRDAIAPLAAHAASRPEDGAAQLELALALHRCGRHAEALVAYREAARRDRRCAVAYLNAGILHHALTRDLVRAERCFRKALALAPERADTRVRLGRLLEENRDLDGALALAREAVAIAPRAPEALSLLAHIEARLCDWSHRTERSAALVRAFASSDHSDLPALDLNFHGADPPTLRKAARGYADAVRRRAAEMVPLPPLPQERAPGRLRIGYLSQDLRNHAVGQLFHAVFAAHERARVEVTAYSLIDSDDAIQRSVREGVEHFVSVAGQDARAIAERIRADSIEVLIDLGGFTGHARAEVCALRPAPVQLLHLGYLTTTGAQWYDGMIADATVATEELRAHFSEDLILLPECFAVASPLPMREAPFARAHFGLPEDRVVLCCMSRPVKYDPATLAAWMEILRAAPEAVLWLFDDEIPACRRNLLAAAESHGVAPERLHFAPQLPHADYLASYRVADLFLDTFAYNACATAVGALLAGLPVLSCLGNTFLSRAGGGIARAAGTPSLVVESRAEYVRRAVELVRDAGERRALRETIASRRGPLFDVAAHARAIEEVAFRSVLPRGGARP